MGLHAPEADLAVVEGDFVCDVSVSELLIEKEGRCIPAEIPAVGSGTAAISAGPAMVVSGTCPRSGSSWVTGGSMVAFAIQVGGVMRSVCRATWVGLAAQKELKLMANIYLVAKLKSFQIEIYMQDLMT